MAKHGDDRSGSLVCSYCGKSQDEVLKLIAGRTRDLADIEDVMLAQPALDEGYLRHWAGPLGVAEKLEAALLDRP